MKFLAKMKVVVPAWFVTSSVLLRDAVHKFACKTVGGSFAFAKLSALMYARARITLAESHLPLRGWDQRKLGPLPLQTLDPAEPG